MRGARRNTRPLEGLAEALQLEARCIPALTSLPADHQQQLVDMVHSAQAAQREALLAAIEGALSHVPALLRRPLVKILRG